MAANTEWIALAGGAGVVKAPADAARLTSGPDIPASTPAEAPQRTPAEAPSGSPEEHPDSRPNEAPVETPQEVPQQPGSVER